MRGMPASSAARASQRSSSPFDVRALGGVVGALGPGPVGHLHGLGGRGALLALVLGAGLRLLDLPGADARGLASVLREVAVRVERPLGGAQHAHDDARAPRGASPTRRGGAGRPGRAARRWREARAWRASWLTQPVSLSTAEGSIPAPSSSCRAARSPFSVRRRSRYVLRTDARSSSLPPCRTVPREMGGTLVGIDPEGTPPAGPVGSRAVSRGQ